MLTLYEACFKAECCFPWYSGMIKLKSARSLKKISVLFLFFSPSKYTSIDFLRITLVRGRDSVSERKKYYIFLKY